MEDYFYWFWVLTISYIFLVFLFRVWVYLWWRPKRIQLHFFKQGIKGPPYHFLLGNTKELVRLMLMASSKPMPLSHNILPRVLSFYHHWKKIYGATFVVWFGPTARLTVSDPVLIQEVLNMKSDLFEKTEPPLHVKKLEGDGLLTLKGEKWAFHRKIISSTFYLENLKLMIPIMGKSTMKMLEKWMEMSSSSGGMVRIEVSKWFEALIEEIITHTVFGSSYEDGKIIFELQQQMLYAIGSYSKVFFPGYRFLPSKKNRISWRLDREIKKSLNKLIRERIKSYSNNGVVSDDQQPPNDLLELMIKARNIMKQKKHTRSSDSTKSSCSCSSESMISVHDIVEECKTIFFAGKHTTSALLTWTTILLAMHPHWQQLARDEVLAACGAREIPTKDDVSKLKTLGMILNESLRLYPPVVAILRQAKVDVELGGYMVPRGTELLLPILAIHHDQALWGYDATEFNPNRFTLGVAHAAKHPMAFMPFGLGSRRCIGQNLAILQAKLAIAMILQRFSFDLAPSYQHAPTVVMLLNPQHGAPIVFRKL
ncbi:Cytochrome P450 734A1 [Camellia lanceoleosa]|uniref:Cytochrome P450 734A1 n=1 Tax=Camellia lanceoleosa TaxID=1840588 RepID=A0ACC0HVS2_9ERIC|nr:Cytochrome P450 734A1 [Camellia lanceoleosa]